MTFYKINILYIIISHTEVYVDIYSGAHLLLPVFVLSLKGAM